MLKSLLIVFLLLPVMFADARWGKIAGLITCNNERLSGALIKNINTRTSALSDYRGEFTMFAKIGDTLVSSKDFYTNDTLRVTDQQDIIIQLRKNPLILKEVIVNSTAITPATTYSENKKEYKEIYTKGDQSHMVGVSVGMVPGVALNIDKVYNALSKQGHDARRLQRGLTKDYKSSIIDKRFNPIAARITGYKGKQLSDFIMDNRPTYEMIIKWTDYNIAEYIKTKFPGKKKT